MKKLAAKSQQHAGVIAEIESLQQKEIALEAEEKQLLDSASLEDAATFKRLSDIRLTRELIPRKILQLEAKLDPLDVELRAELDAAARQIFGVFRKETAELKGSIFKMLRGLTSNLSEDAPIIDDVLRQSDSYRNRLAHLDISTSTFNNTYTSPAESARQLLALATRFNIA